MNSQTTPSTTPTPAAPTVVTTNFEAMVGDSMMQFMREGFVCFGRNLQVIAWNQAMENMTGLNEQAMLGRTISPSIFKMHEKTLGAITQDNCPFQASINSGETIEKTYTISGRSGRELEVEFAIHPVKDHLDNVHGAIALLHDNSDQIELQRQLNELYMKAILDPLTQVANRAEFERLLEEYVRSHREADMKCSIIICDIDFFKGINDNYGHHIGDQALISFAQLLKQFVRKDDFVARYGGEEFVILCANCDEEAAVQRAEDIRFRLEKTPQPMLDGKCMTASFGVSQLEDGDDSTTLFVRADHSLLKAKEMGRNRVVRADDSAINDDELGSGVEQSVTGVKWRKLKGENLLHVEFQTRTPIEVLFEKISHMIPEINGEYVSASENHVSLTCETSDPTKAGQNSCFKVELDLRKVEDDDEHFDDTAESFLRVVIQSGRKGWFQRNNDGLANQVLMNIRQYLGLSEDLCVVKVNRAVNSSGRD